MQIFSIHILLNTIMVPVVYALLPNKRQNTYERVFDCLRERLGERNLPLEIRRFSSDFEEGVLNAIRSRFPGINLL